MAFAGSAPRSSPAVTGPSHSHPMAAGMALGAARSDTPPVNSHQQQQQPPSKRDKRRNALQEKYQDLTETFANSRDAQFRQTVHELQNEMALIAFADVSDTAPLSDSPEDVAQQLQKLAANNQIISDVIPSGRWYSRFVQEVNKMKEERDAELVEVKTRHRDNLIRIQEERDFRRQLAIDEHAKLRETIRERLVVTISSRKNRLMRDKEQLDIADTSALLLHPNQFSITNPASPGGVHGNRKTRHTRRGADFEELGSGIGAEPMNKRKRKVPMDEDNGSPPRDTAAPPDRTKGRAGLQQNGSAYNISSLFTEKELAMHCNVAHVASVHFLSAAKKARLAAASGLGTNGQNTDQDEASLDDDASGDENVEAEAPEMERVSSQNVHATRSTRNTNGAAGTLLAELADKNTTRPNLPYYVLGNYHSRPNGNLLVPPPSALLTEEVEDDMALFERARSKPKGWVDERLLKSLLQSMREVEDNVPATKRHRFSNLHPDFPPRMDVHMVRADRQPKASLPWMGPTV